MCKLNKEEDTEKSEICICRKVLCFVHEWVKLPKRHESVWIKI